MLVLTREQMAVYEFKLRKQLERTMTLKKRTMIRRQTHQILKEHVGTVKNIKPSIMNTEGHLIYRLI